MLKTLPTSFNFKSFFFLLLVYYKRKTEFDISHYFSTLYSWDRSFGNIQYSDKDCDLISHFIWLTEIVKKEVLDYELQNLMNVKYLLNLDENIGWSFVLICT